MISAFLFLLFFVALWLMVTALLCLFSGWFRLMVTYPDNPEPALLKLEWQSGWMGAWVNMRGILTLSACPSGLRVGMLRIFGPFCSNLFIPWTEIKAKRGQVSLTSVTLEFGSPVVGRLGVRVDVADRLARASAGGWSEPGSFPKETSAPGRQ